MDGENVNDNVVVMKKVVVVVVFYYSDIGETVTCCHISLKKKCTDDSPGVI